MLWRGTGWGTPLLPGDPGRVGPYWLIGRLGAGSMGIVYLARSRSGLLVAVKTMQADLLSEPRFRQRFAREAAAARRVSGVFTAAVVDADAHAPMPWLATAFVPAPSLHHLVHAAGPLPPRAVWWIAAGIAEALDSIHAAGLVHRDLKPSNVLVAADNPKVIDFGIARAVDGTQNPTHSIIGTPAYMPPEQAVDDPSVTTAGDVYGLGATMLFAATGHGPYSGDTPINVIARLLTAPPNLDGLPDELIDAVASCMHRDPTLRPGPDALLTTFEERIGAASDAYGAQDWLPPEAFALVRDYGRPSAQELGPLRLGAASDDQPSASTPRSDGHRATAPFPISSAEPTPSHRAPDIGRRRMIPLALAMIVIAGLVVWAIDAFATDDSEDSAPPATSDRPLDTTSVLIKNWATKKCVDVPGFEYGTVAGQVSQFTCVGGSGDNQLWDLETRGERPMGGTLYLIRNVKDGYCLDIPNYGAEPSTTKVSEYHCDGTTRDNQLWWLDERADDVYWIRNYVSNHLCLDVDGEQPTANDIPLAISTCSDNGDQWWSVRSH